MRVIAGLSIRVVAVPCVMLALVACGHGRTDDFPASVPTSGTHLDSSPGEVTQYSLMGDPAVWLTDSNLVTLATIVNQAPLRLARIESEVSTDRAVHELALEVLRDHTAFQVSLDSLASKRRIVSQRPAVAKSFEAPYDSVIADLSPVSAQQMPQRYLAAEKAIDARALTDFGALGGNTTDPDLRVLLAIRAITMEQRHVARANQLAISLVQADSAKQAARSERKP